MRDLVDFYLLRMFKDELKAVGLRWVRLSPVRGDRGFIKSNYLEPIQMSPTISGNHMSSASLSLHSLQLLQTAHCKKADETVCKAHSGCRLKPSQQHGLLCSF